MIEITTQWYYNPAVAAPVKTKKRSNIVPDWLTNLSDDPTTDVRNKLEEGGGFARASFFFRVVLVSFGAGSVCCLCGARALRV